jgi:hypothetical protein
MFFLSFLVVIIKFIIIDVGEYGKKNIYAGLFTKPFLGKSLEVEVFNILNFYLRSNTEKLLPFITDGDEGFL